MLAVNGDGVMLGATLRTMKFLARFHSLASGFQDLGVWNGPASRRLNNARQIVGSDWNPVDYAPRDLESDRFILQTESSALVLPT